MTRRILRRLTGVAAATVVMACEKSPTPPPPTQPAQLHLTALVSASSVTSIVVTVSAADISPSLVFNFPVSNGVAAGTMTVPVGSDRHFRISAFDAGGIETQQADTTITVESGSNPPLAVTLTPLTGSQPIVVTIASLRIAVGPADTTILVGASASFRAQAFDGTGSDITGQVTFAWASSNPSIASVDSQGVVTAHLSGTVSIVAVARGVAGVATLTVVTTERVAVCAAGSPDHLVTFADFPAAIAAVAPGGTIEVCSGTFTAEGVEITKPVTIEAVRGATTPPVIETSTDTVTFFIDSVASGTVAFRGLSFVNTDTGSTVISAIDTYDQVLVEGSTFAIPPIGTGVFGGSSTVAGAKITVTHSAFSGGLFGVFAAGDVDSSGNPILSGAPHFDVLNSTFHNFRFSGIQYQGGTSGRIAGNTVSACGFNGCIRSVLDNHIEILNNAVTVEGDRLINGRHIRWGIAADGVLDGSQVIRGNTVTGIGGVANPTDPTSYAVSVGIAVGRINPRGVGNATVSGNLVVNADTGLTVRDAVITGSDNLINGVFTGVTGVSVSRTTSVSLNKSDVTTYVVSMGGNGLANLTCNWWGAVVGPQNVPADVSPTVFTPWATGPIANGAGGACNGRPAPVPRLSVGMPQGDVAAGLPISVAVTVLDAAGNRVSGSTLAVTLSLEPNPQGATLAGTLTVNAVDGIATFNDLRLSRAGRGFVLSATADSLSGTSSPFDARLRLVSVSVGNGMACGLAPSGDAYCWGRNQTGGLGAGTSGTNQPRPVLVAGGLTFTQVDAGSGSNINGVFDGGGCGVIGTGTAYCWGRNALGQLGNGQAGVDSKVPVPVSGGIQFQSVSVGRDHACGLAQSGQIYCWGDNDAGQLGNHSRGVNSDVPVPVSGGLSYTALFVGDISTCARATSGDVYCWGSGAPTDQEGGPLVDSPTLLGGGLLFTEVDPGTFLHLCGVTTTHDGYCWGQDLGSGALGTGTPGPAELTPALVAGGYQWASIGAGGAYSCGLRVDGVAMCWGTDFTGELGQGAVRAMRSTPAAVVGGLTFTQIAVSIQTVCALAANGDAYCWGAGFSGERGDGTFDLQAATPVKVVTP